MNSLTRSLHSAATKLQRRRMSTMFDTKNTIKDHRQKYYSNPATGAENPTYLKEPTDKIFVAIGFTGFTVGLVLVLSGLYNMSFGVNKIKR